MIEILFLLDTTIPYYEVMENFISFFKANNFVMGNKISWQLSDSLIENYFNNSQFYFCNYFHGNCTKNDLENFYGLLSIFN